MNLTFIIVRHPSNGTLALEVVGGVQKFRYTPNPGSVGIDSYDFKATDGVQESNVATMEIVVKDDTAQTFVVFDDTAGVVAGEFMLFCAVARTRMRNTKVTVFNFAPGSYGQPPQIVRLQLVIRTTATQMEQEILSLPLVIDAFATEYDVPTLIDEVLPGQCLYVRIVEATFGIEGLKVTMKTRTLPD